MTTPCVDSRRPGPRILLHEQDRLAAGVHHPDRVEDRLEHLRRQAHRRLVQYHQARVEHQAAGELHQTLLPAGQAARLLPRPARDLREHLLDVGEPAGDQPPVLDDVRAELDVLPDRHLPEQAVVLRHVHQAQVQDLARALAGQRLAAERDAAPAGPQQPADRREQGGLARPVRPHDAGDPPVGHGHGHVVQHVTAAVARYQALDDERRLTVRGHRSPPPRPGRDRRRALAGRS